MCEDETSPPDISRLLESLLRDETGALIAARNLGLAPDSIANWRAALIDLALRELPTAIEPWAWVQLDVKLIHSDAAYVSLLRSDLVELLMKWMATDEIENFWYLHKSPGLRLRVQGDIAGLRTQLAGPAQRLVETGAATGWQFGHYLPEIHLFGGTNGLRLTHALFSADSIAVLRYYRLREAGSARNGPVEFSLAMVLSLADSMVPDPWERWGAWCDLGGWGRLALEQEFMPGRRRDRAIEWVSRFVDEDSLTSATLEECGVLSEFRESITALTKFPWSAHISPTLPRVLLPAWTVFHWNRMGFPQDVQRILGRLLEVASRPPTKV